ncbi:MAG: T9SS type A sorting domain-containing protein [Bacteroidales bacterium]|nr:T9SS type A sorting domain-containing protein [Bacteroidales bacterium]
MKYLTIVTILFSLTLTLSAQIEFEASYSYSGSLTEIDEGEYKYFVMDVPQNQCRLYNEDHSPFKTIDLSVPAGYYLSDIKYVSRRTFNNDDNIELLYLYYKVALINSQSVYTYGLKVVSETGDVLLSLTDGSFAEIKEGSDGPRLLAYQYIWNDSYYLVNTLVYTLASSTKSSVSESAQGVSVFPNPTEDQLNIRFGDSPNFSGGKVIISDISGKQISEQAYPEGEQHFKMNTQNLPAGTYIVNLLSKEGIQVSEKIVKK